jgi:L-amino acid N-acyltransferase YncA
LDEVIKVRAAVVADFPAITAIYADACLNGTGTFTLLPPSLEEMITRFHEVTRMKLPYYVAYEGEALIGFAYVGPFRLRPAYRYGVEDSLYIHPNHQGKGVGKALLSALVYTCTELGFYQMIAVIGDGQNQASLGVHKALGFERTGELPKAGYKLGQWLDVVIMCKDLKPRETPPIGQGWDIL